MTQWRTILSWDVSRIQKNPEVIARRLRKIVKDLQQMYIEDYGAETEEEITGVWSEMDVEPVFAAVEKEFPDTDLVGTGGGFLVIVVRVDKTSAIVLDAYNMYYVRGRSDSGPFPLEPDGSIELNDLGNYDSYLSSEISVKSIGKGFRIR